MERLMPKSALALIPKEKLNTDDPSTVNNTSITITSDNKEGNQTSSPANSKETVPSTVEENTLQEKEALSSQSQDSFNKSLENDGAKKGRNRLFGFIGSGINKIFKRSSSPISVLRGPSETITNTSLMLYFQLKFLDGTIKEKTSALVIEGKASMNYESLRDNSYTIAESLKEELEEYFSNQKKDNDIVIAVCLPPFIKHRISLIFGILMSGATYLPINLDYPEEKIRTILDGCKVVATIISRSDFETVDFFQNLRSNPNVVGKVLFLEKICKPIYGTKKTSKLYEESLIACKKKNSKGRERTVCILPSFSNNGSFKGIRYPSGSILNMLNWDEKTFPDETTMSSTTYVPSFFAATPDCMEAIKEIFFTLLRGKTLVIFYENQLIHPDRFLDRIAYYRVSKLVVCPTFLQLLLSSMQLNSKRSVFSKLIKLCVCVGEPMSVDLATNFFRFAGEGSKLALLYGHDEDASTVTYQIYHSLKDVQHLEYCNSLPVGKPINNFKLYITNPEMKIVPPGVVGEICISGPGLIPKFRKDPSSKITKNIFTKSLSSDYKFLLRTGDYGRIINNRLVFEESKADCFYIDEHYFNLRELSFLLDNYFKNEYHIRVKDWNDRNTNAKVTVFVSCKDSTKNQHIDILPYLKKKLPKWAIPRIVPFDTDPLENPNRNARLLKLVEELEEQQNKNVEYNDWKNLSLASPEEIKAAKVLLCTLSSIISVSVQELASNLTKPIHHFEVSYYAMVLLAEGLGSYGYCVPGSDIDKSTSLLEIISKMIEKQSVQGVVELQLHHPRFWDTYRLELLTDESKNNAIEILTHNYTKMGSLNYYTQTKPNDIKAVIEKQWPEFSKDYMISFVLRKIKSKKIYGCILNLYWSDARKIDKDTPKALSPFLELQSLLEIGFPLAVRGKNLWNEEPLRAIQIVHFGLLPYLTDLCGYYEMLTAMINKSIRLAAIKKCPFVLITVHDLYISELCERKLGFISVSEYQANTFVASNGEKPYADAPDSLICKFMMKQL